MESEFDSIFDCYKSYGFSENPFTVHALRADEKGKRLMVGRDEQIKLVAQRLHKDGKITCLDGHVGVGKTSLVNIAVFECFNAFFSGKTQQLLIPLNHSFQLKKDEDIDDFCEKVFRKVASGLLSHRKFLAQQTSIESSLQNLDAWLNSPIIEFLNHTTGGTASVGIPGVVSGTGKLDVSQARVLNTGTGFAKEGLEEQVKNWLNEIFVVEGTGGLVCVIDNLELLESGTNARRVLEALRDRLFTVNGLRWVFCGADGVIHSLAASPRLGAFLNTPIIDVRNIASGNIDNLIRARLKEFSDDPAASEKMLPIRIEDIATLYPIINFNLRDLLHYVDDYCEHQFNLGKSSFLNNESKSARFKKWLERLTTESYSTLSMRIEQKAWAILDVVMSNTYKGTFGIGDYSSLNSNSKTEITKNSFDKSLRDFIKLGLITKNIDDSSSSDDDETKRDVYTVTAKGALIHYARLIKQENQSVVPTDWLRRVH